MDGRLHEFGTEADTSQHSHINPSLTSIEISKETFLRADTRRQAKPYGFYEPVPAFSFLSCRLHSIGLRLIGFSE